MSNDNDSNKPEDLRDLFLSDPRAFMQTYGAVIDEALGLLAEQEQEEEPEPEEEPERTPPPALKRLFEEKTEPTALAPFDPRVHKAGQLKLQKEHKVRMRRKRLIEKKNAGSLEVKAKGGTQKIRGRSKRVQGKEEEFFQTPVSKTMLVRTDRSHTMTKRGLDDKMNFGKHKNKTLKEVIISHPDYISWCIANVDWFEMTPMADLTYKQRIEWREVWYNGKKYQFSVTQLDTFEKRLDIEVDWNSAIPSKPWALRRARLQQKDKLDGMNRYELIKMLNSQRILTRARPPEPPETKDDDGGEICVCGDAGCTIGPMMPLD